MPFKLGSISRAISAVLSKAALHPNLRDQQKRRAVGPPFLFLVSFSRDYQVTGI